MCPESKVQSEREGAGSAVPGVSQAIQLLIEERQAQGSVVQKVGRGACVPILAARQRLAGSHL